MYDRLQTANSSLGAFPALVMVQENDDGRRIKTNRSIVHLFSLEISRTKRFLHTDFTDLFMIERRFVLFDRIRLFYCNIQKYIDKALNKVKFVFDN